MFLSLARRALIRGSDGQPIWRETSQLYFPKGGKKLTFITGSISGIVIVFGVTLYGVLQSEINPDSKAGTTFRALIRDPLKWLGADKAEKYPNPTHSSHLKLLKQLDFPAAKFSLFFMGYKDASEIPQDDSEKARFALSTLATIELTHNWGTEHDPDFNYHNGNRDPRGFGHIGIVVPDVEKACERFEKLGVQFIKKPNDGNMKGLAFIQDPDGYWIEIFNPQNINC